MWNLAVCLHPARTHCWQPTSQLHVAAPSNDPQPRAIQLVRSLRLRDRSEDAGSTRPQRSGNAAVSPAAVSGCDGDIIANTASAECAARASLDGPVAEFILVPGSALVRYGFCSSPRTLAWQNLAGALCDARCAQQSCALQRHSEPQGHRSNLCLCHARPASCGVHATRWFGDIEFKLLSVADFRRG